MNALQHSNMRKLALMQYRFNCVVRQGRSYVLKNKVELLTGVKHVVTVAILSHDGDIEMGDAAY